MLVFLYTKVIMKNSCFNPYNNLIRQIIRISAFWFSAAKDSRKLYTYAHIVPFQQIQIVKVTPDSKGYTKQLHIPRYPKVSALIIELFNGESHVVFSFRYERQSKDRIRSL